MLRARKTRRSLVRVMMETGGMRSLACGYERRQAGRDRRSGSRIGRDTVDNEKRLFCVEMRQAVGVDVAQCETKCCDRVPVQVERAPSHVTRLARRSREVF